MENYDQSVKINHNSNCTYIPNHPYKISINGGSGSGKKCDTELNKIQRPDTDKIYLLYKTLIGPKPLQLKFDKMDGLIKIYDGTRYLTLSGSENCDAIYNKIR